MLRYLQPHLARSVLAPPPATAKVMARPQIIYAPTGTASNRALRRVWPLVCRRLEEFPNINSTQLFEELCVQFPGRFTLRQYNSLNRRVKRWRRHARARGVVIEHLNHRRLTEKPRGRRRDQLRRPDERAVNSRGQIKNFSRAGVFFRPLPSL